MPWIVLVLSGLLEVGWASLLPRTEGFTRPVPSALVLVLLAASMVGIAFAAKSIPIGTAYAVWVGIGAAGAAFVGIVAYDEPASAFRLVLLAALVCAIAGLSVTGPSRA